MSLQSEVIRIINRYFGNSKKISELPDAVGLTGAELVEVVQGGENKKTTTAALTGGTGVQSIVAGTNITIDDTDPQNPIVSASGGGGSFDGIADWDFPGDAFPTTPNKIYRAVGDFEDPVSGNFISDNTWFCSKEGVTPTGIYADFTYK